MDITIVKEAPYEVREFTDQPELSPEQVKHVAEIFNTPLTGAYNWDYSEQDNRIKKLYALGKQLNWNADIDIDWSKKKKRWPSFARGFPAWAISPMKTWISTRSSSSTAI